MSADVPSVSAGASHTIHYQAKTGKFRSYATVYAIANLAIALLWGSITIVLLPLHVQHSEFAHYFTGPDASISLQQLNDLRAQVSAGTVTPDADQNRLLSLLNAYNAAKASGLSVVTAVGVGVTMLIQPIAGMLSDRTRSRWGRRAPWIAAGAVVGGASISLMPVVPTIAILVVLWSIAQLFVNLAQGPLGATVADRVPANRIGAVSAISGLVFYVGTIGGAIAAGSLFGAIGLGAYVPLAIAMVVGVLLFVIVARDTSSRELHVPQLKASMFLLSFVAAIRDHDYRWAWIAKVILNTGYGISSVYTIYMLQSYITPALSEQQAAQTAPLLLAAGLPGTLVAMGVAGRWSDKVQRRKPFVIAASTIMSVGFLVPFIWPSLSALFIQSVIVGVGFGGFIVVDQALFIEILPDRDAAGRDLGFSTLGQNLGQALGPVIAGAIVVICGGLTVLSGWARSSSFCFPR